MTTIALERSLISEISEILGNKELMTKVLSYIRGLRNSDQTVAPTSPVAYTEEEVIQRLKGTAEDALAGRGMSMHEVKSAIESWANN